MGSTALVSVEEYLRTSFRDADREYVDGHIVERNVGRVDHSDVQTLIAHYLRKVRRSKFPSTNCGLNLAVD